MKFNYTRTLEDGVFKTVVTFDSLGSTDMTEEEESKIFSDLGYPVIDVGGSEYLGYFKVESGVVTMYDTESADTQAVTLVRTSKSYTVDSNFSVDYEIDSNKIADSTIKDSDILNTKLKLAEAKCVLFEKNLEIKIKAAIKKIKDQATKFEENVPESFIA